MTLWTASDAAAATKGQARGDWQATGVSIDTRTLQAGDLFVALKDQRDGHEFVAQALKKGAAAALVTHIPEGVAEDAPLLLVDDVLAALERLGVAARARTKARVVAVTGSVGKTSTKEMLREVLSRQGRTHAAEASYNNHWGVPLTLARMPANTEFAVIEIGMNHPGEIAPLAHLARPHVAMITTVAAAHLEAFENIEGIAREKAAIFSGLEPGGVAVMNADLETSSILRSAAESAQAGIIEFGQDANDYRLISARIVSDQTIVEADLDGEPVVFKIMSAGRHFAMNGLGVLGVIKALGADTGLAAVALAGWMPYKGRGVREVIALDPVEEDMTLQLYDDSYNANPTSMGAALNVLAAAEVIHDIGRVSKGRRIAYLGDMKELGTDAADMHRAMALHPAIEAIDQVHAIGPLMKHMWQALPEHKRGRWSESADEMVGSIRGDLDAGDVVLAKGSLSMRLAVVVDVIRKMGQVTPGGKEGA